MSLRQRPETKVGWQPPPDSPWREAWRRYASLVWAIAAALLLLFGLFGSQVLDSRASASRSAAVFHQTRRLETWLAERQAGLVRHVGELASQPALRAAAASGRGPTEATPWLAAWRAGCEAVWLWDRQGRLLSGVSSHGDVTQLAAAWLSAHPRDGQPAAGLVGLGRALWLVAVVPFVDQRGRPAGGLGVACRLTADRLAEVLGSSVSILPGTPLVQPGELARLGPAAGRDSAVVRRAEALSAELGEPAALFVQFVTPAGGPGGTVAVALRDPVEQSIDRGRFSGFGALLCLALWLAASLLPPFGPLLAATWRGRRATAPTDPVTTQAADALGHHLQNAASVIVLNGRLLERQLQDAEQRQSLRDMIQAAQSMSRLIRRLQRVVLREPLGRPGPVDLAAVVAAAVARMERRLGAQRTIRVGELAGLVVSGLIDDVTTLVALLVENAVEATDETGVIEIAARGDGEMIELSVRDNGEGMDPATAARAREPFYTGRDPRHAGLGLAAVDGMVQRHGGTWWIDTAPGAGCTVHVRLPAWRDEA